MSEDYELVQVAFPGPGVLNCRDDLCERKGEEKGIRPGETYFLDTLTKRAYCDACGKCLRYARKKAVERGEEIRSATQ